MKNSNPVPTDLHHITTRYRTSSAAARSLHATIHFVYYKLHQGSTINTSVQELFRYEDPMQLSHWLGKLSGQIGQSRALTCTTPHISSMDRPLKPVLACICETSSLPLTNTIQTQVARIMRDRHAPAILGVRTANNSSISRTILHSSQDARLRYPKRRESQTHGSCFHAQPST
jgi:hypothetical protein